MIKSNIKKNFSCEKEKLWNIVTNNKDYSWRSDVSKIDIVDDVHFIEYANNGYPTFFTIIKKDITDGYQFELENTNMKGKWIGFFRSCSDGTVELDFTEEVEVSSPIMRVVAKLYLKKQQARYMKDLERQLISSNKD